MTNNRPKPQEIVMKLRDAELSVGLSISRPDAITHLYFVAQTKSVPPLDEIAHTGTDQD